MSQSSAARARTHPSIETAPRSKWPPHSDTAPTRRSVSRTPSADVLGEMTWDRCRQMDGRQRGRRAQATRLLHLPLNYAERDRTEITLLRSLFAACIYRRVGMVWCPRGVRPRRVSHTSNCELEFGLDCDGLRCARIDPCTTTTSARPHARAHAGGVSPAPQRGCSIQHMHMSTRTTLPMAHTDTETDTVAPFSRRGEMRWGQYNWRSLCVRSPFLATHVVTSF